MAKSSKIKWLVISIIYMTLVSFTFGQILYENEISPRLTRSQQKSDERVSQLIGRNVLQMAHDIGTNILQKSTEKTAVFSPLSIYSALSLLLLGANADTFDELMKLLKFDEDFILANSPWRIHEEFGLLIRELSKDSQPIRQSRTQSELTSGFQSGRQFQASPGNFDDNVEHRITIANGLFVQKGFSIRPDFRNAVISTYGAKLKSLDFTYDTVRSTKYINDWVKEKSEGKIQHILSDVNPYTKMIVANVLHFKAMWDKSFMQGTTSMRPFYPDGLGTTPIQVEMMATGGPFPYYDAKEYDCRILGLPYKRNLTTMYIILPNNSNRQRLREFQAYLTADRIDDMISKMQYVTTIIVLPKLHITNRVDLASTLNELGVKSLFSSYKSDLSLMSTGEENRPFVHSPTFHSMTRPNTFPTFSTFPTLPPFSKINSFSAAPQAPLAPQYSFSQDYEDEPFLFSRIGIEDDSDLINSTDSTTVTTTNLPSTNKTKVKRDVTYKVEKSGGSADDFLRFKDYLISKRITKLNPLNKKHRAKRQTENSKSALKNLDQLREDLSQQIGNNPGLYADQIIHQIDLTVNEKGTDGGAATLITLFRTGPDTLFRVETPYLFLVRHDATKLPLFYGTVYEPTN